MIKKALAKKNPLEPQPCSPSGRLLAPLKSKPMVALQDQDDGRLWDTCSPGKGKKYLAPLSMQHSASSGRIDWSSGSQQTRALQYESTLGDSCAKYDSAAPMTKPGEWQPFTSSTLALTPKKRLDLTNRFCMSIPRSLSLRLPRRESGSGDLSRLYWPKQVNSSISGPSGMLLRIERLRQAVIKMNGELQKNRVSLQVIRQSYQRSVQPDENSQLALPSSPSSPLLPAPAKPEISVTVSFSATDLKDFLDAEENQEEERNHTQSTA
jgi:hypothetical protein